MGATDFKIVYDQGSFDIREGANLIGRKDADITIPVSSLSKEHARIIRAGSRLEIEDAGSKNGTMLNDEPVQGRMLVEPGDVIVLGGKVELHVVSGDQPVPPSRATGGSAAGPKSGKVALEDSKRSADAPPRRDERPSAPDAPPPAKSKFTIVQGDGKGKVVELTADKQFTLGSKEENGLALKGEGISRYHAEVVYEKGVWLLKDLGSRNGTFVRERKVDLHELATGDVIQIGSVHLRFEAIEARKPGDPRDLISLVKEDPKAALRSPHIRRAGMLLVGAAALGIMAYAKRKPEDAPPPPIDPGETIRTVHETVNLLRKEEAGKADAYLGKAIRALGPYRQNVTYNNLEKVVKKWVDHKAPLTFEWTDAVQAIDVVIRGSTPETVDQDCLEWLQKARTETEAEIPNAELRKQADLLMTRGQNELRAGKKEGPETLKDAREAFKKMPPSSVFAESARQRAENIRTILLEYFKREGEVRVAERPPRWKDAMDHFEEAIRFANSLDEKRPITERIGYCEINRRDVETLTEVVKIVQSKDDQSFGRARELLDSIGDKSYYHRNAQAYRAWFKADTLARQAISAYNQGQLENAQRLMGEAIKQPELEPPVVASGRAQIERWKKVEESLRKGFDCVQKGDITMAKELFRGVLELEPVKENIYRQRAEKELAILENREQEDLDTALKQGIDLLEAGKCDEAYEKFCFVLERAQNPGPPRTLIEEAVARVNVERGLYKEANGIFKSGNKNRYPRAHEILQLLGRFLPDKNADRQAAIDLLPRVK